MEERDRILPSLALGKTDRNKTGDCDERPGEHRRGKLRIGEGCRLLHRVAHGQTPERGVDSRHRVVDEKRERDDQSAKRNAVKVDAQHLHDEKHRRKRNRDGHGNDGAGPYAERDEAHRQDDQNRLIERCREVADGGRHHVGLVRYERDVDANGNVGERTLHGGVHRLAKLKHVAAFAH